MSGSPHANERRPAGDRAASELADTHSVAVATVEYAEHNSDSAFLVRVRCPFCGELHRHAWDAGDREHGQVERMASCGRGAYQLTGCELLDALGGAQ